MTPIEHPGEPAGNALRAMATAFEPKSLRTYTPTLAVIGASSGVYHYTPDGRRLFDFTSGVLVSNLGHNPARWTGRFLSYSGLDRFSADLPMDYFDGVPLTAYNAVTPVGVEASRRLVDLLRGRTGGGRLEQVMWAASGSEAIQKSLWAALARDRDRPLILATRHGFHGKKGLSGAVSGSEADPDRDPRVKFIPFPMAECRDLSMRQASFDPAPFRAGLDRLHAEHGRRLGCLITEPYLGGGGSYHPPPAYLQLLQQFCREHDLVFILDEVQSNFGRTGKLFAYETYGLEPDVVVLGKGLGNGVPVAAAVGRADLLGAMSYGDTSDTWSANPLAAAAVLATLDEFAARDVLGAMAEASAVIEAGLVGLKEYPFVGAVRGERGGMVWGVEFADHGNGTAAEWANAFVLAAYRGAGPTADGVHLLGPLARKVVRVSPPLVITPAEARAAVGLLHQAAGRM